MSMTAVTNSSKLPALEEGATRPTEKAALEAIVEDADEKEKHDEQ
jgi:hypothetical protein